MQTNPSWFARTASALSLVLGALACGGTMESSTRQSLQEVEDEFRFSARAVSDTADVRPPESGTLDDYVAHALRQNAGVRVAFERWRAATLSISGARRLPEPMLTYGYFIRSVETRVGPQRHRFSLSQVFPWPTQLSEAAEAEGFEARARQKEFDAQLLSLRGQVADVYWRLWLIHETHRLKSEHDAVLETLAGAVRARVSVNQATLAELNLVELQVARHHDHQAEHLEAARAATAELSALLGGGPIAHYYPTPDSPPEGLPTATEEQLSSLVADHPALEVHAWESRASGARAASEEARGLPSFRLGVDYIEVGPAVDPSSNGSGDDALMVSLGVTVPLWFGSYSEAAEAQNAQARVHLAEQSDARIQRRSALSISLSRLRDTQRRIGLFRDTLIPQAETVYLSQLGSYQVGRAGVSDMLLAQKELLELGLMLAHARSQHARAWARLEWVVGERLEVSETEVSHATLLSEPESPSHGHEGHEHQELEPESVESTESVQTTEPRPRPVIWTCPMHPQIQRTRPGECPICGMDLVRQGRRR